MDLDASRTETLKANHSRQLRLQSVQYNISIRCVGERGERLVAKAAMLVSDDIFHDISAKIFKEKLKSFK